ncbi:MAG: lysophospholipid acyltransferase family protein [Gracilimonas sp.]|nr:lysophospholipid acyltransferase family protein [Gracilimonas sp.]
MRHIAAVIKLFAFLLVTLFYYSIMMAVLVLSLVGVNYEKYRGYLLNYWGKSVCMIMRIKFEISGKVPEPPFFLVSNHLSYTDIFVLFSQLRCLFVAKSDVKQWPFIGFIVKTCGILFIDRERKRDITRVNDNISKNINENQGIIIFPEGTTSPGANVLRFRAPLLQYPASMNFPVSYVALSYRTPENEESAYRSVCWWEDIPFFVHFYDLLKLKSITCFMRFGEETIARSDRKELTISLNKAVSERLKPTIMTKEFNLKHGEFEPLKI